MTTFRSLHPVRWFHLAAAAAFVLSVPAIARAQGDATAPAAGKSTATKSHAKHAMAAKKDALEDRLEAMSKRLKLTDEEKEKVKPILQADMDQMRDLNAKYKGKTATAEEKKAMAKERRDLHADTDAKLAQVLTADQMTEYKEMRAGHKKKESAKEEKAEEAKEGKK